MHFLGIIGGVGPASGGKLYLKIMERCHKLHVLHRPHVLLDSIPIPFAVEQELLLEGKGESFIPHRYTYYELICDVSGLRYL